MGSEMCIRDSFVPQKFLTQKFFFDYGSTGWGRAQKVFVRFFVFLTSSGSDWIASANSRVCLRHRQKEGRYGPPNWGNFGAFDGEVENLTLNISGAEYFSGPKFTSGRGPLHPLPTCQTWSCSGVHFAPQKFLTQKLFFDYGSTGWGRAQKVFVRLSFS